MGSADVRRWAPGRVRCAALLLACALAGCASHTEPWPGEVVRPEDMSALNMMRTSAVLPRGTERGGRSTVVLRLHVDAEGRTQPVGLVQSSGIASLDEAAMQTAREARFAPYVKGGSAQAVTLVMPMHYPLRAAVR